MQSTHSHTNPQATQPEFALAPLGASAIATHRARAAAGLRRVRRGTRHLASEIGQGTVEYVGLLLLMATLLAAIVAAAGQLGGKDQIGKKVVDNIGSSIDKAGDVKR